MTFHLHYDTFTLLHPRRSCISLSLPLISKSETGRWLLRNTELLICCQDLKLPIYLWHCLYQPPPPTLPDSEFQEGSKCFQVDQLLFSPPNTRCDQQQHCARSSGRSWPPSGQSLLFWGQGALGVAPEACAARHGAAIYIPTGPGSGSRRPAAHQGIAADHNSKLYESCSLIRWQWPGNSTEKKSSNMTSANERTRYQTVGFYGPLLPSDPKNLETGINSVYILARPT